MKLNIAWLLIVLAAFFDSYASLIVKSRFNQLGSIDMSSFKNISNYIFELIKSPILVSAIIAFLIAPILWFFALNKINLSIGYPVLVGCHLIFIFLFGVFILGERLTIEKFIAMILLFLSFYIFFK